MTAGARMTATRAADILPLRTDFAQLIDGELIWHSISRYMPTPLEVLENPWIQWSVLLPRDISGTEFDPIRRDDSVLASLSQTVVEIVQGGLHTS